MKQNICEFKTGHFAFLHAWNFDSSVYKLNILIEAMFTSKDGSNILEEI